MRMRKRQAVVALLAAVALCAGCGDGGGSDEDQVREVVSAFVEAGQDRDAEKACSLLAMDQVKSVESLGPGGCAAVLAGIFAQAENVSTELEIQDVRIAEDRATVDATISSPGGRPQAKSVLLVKEDGEWKIASAGL